MTMEAFVRRSRRFTRTVAFIASGSALGMAAFAIRASSAEALTLLPSCAARPSTTPFAPWGDTSAYFLMPGGGFESGAPGWSLAGGP